LGRDSNNYAHLVSLVEASSSSINHGLSPPQPGTKLLPQSTQKIVVRLSNPDAMLDNTVRVQNEVGALTLIQDALSTLPFKVVPDAYSWNPAVEGQGWIVQEYMRGELLGGRFSQLLKSQKDYVMDQVAQIFKLIQSYVPHVKGFGGLNFDDEGKVVTGGSTLWFGGPFETYIDMYLHIFRKQMEISISTALVNGWKGTDVGDRLEKFDQSGGFVTVLNDFSDVQPTLVHGDIS
jgi:hypothetical protein